MQLNKWITSVSNWIREKLSKLGTSNSSKLASLDPSQLQGLTESGSSGNSRSYENKQAQGLSKQSRPLFSTSPHKGVRIALFAGPGAGKCLGKGTPILMYDGSIKSVEDVCIHDELMGPDSKPRKVLGTTSGLDPLYKVTPVKGDPYIVNEHHILSLKMSTDKCGSKKGEIVNISITDYLAKPKSWREKAKGYRIGVTFPEQLDKPLIDAYLMGLWLGDGHSEATRITTMDSEIVKFLKNYCSYNGYTLTKVAPCGKAYTYGITTPRGQSNPLREQLQAHNVWNNKHIPEVYKRGSREVRLQVLAGLIDSDGSLSHNGFDYISNLNRLSNDVAFVARSLGLAAYVKRCTKVCGNNKRKDIYYRVSISGETDQIPTKIKRKRATKRTQSKDALMTGITVEPIGVGEYYGFELDSDGLFLLGDFTVTHNTTLAMAFTAFMKDRGYNWHYVHEYARDFIDTYGSQALSAAGPLIQCKFMDRQINLERKLPAQADGWITDSPVFLGWMYASKYSDVRSTEGFLDVETYIALKDCYKGFLRSLTEYDYFVYVKREKAYVKDGTRTQSEEEAKDIDSLVLTLLKLHNVEVHEISGTTETRCHALLNLIKPKLDNEQ